MDQKCPSKFQNVFDILQSRCKATPPLSANQNENPYHMGKDESLSRLYADEYSKSHCSSINLSLVKIFYMWHALLKKCQVFEHKHVFRGVVPPPVICGALLYC